MNAAFNLFMNRITPFLKKYFLSRELARSLEQARLRCSTQPIFNAEELRQSRFRGKTAACRPCKRDPVMTYRAPINDMLLALNHGAGLQAAVQAGHYGDFDADITAAVLEEAGRFASDVLAPLNRRGDENGIRLENTQD